MRRSFMQSASILGEIEAKLDAQRGLRPLGRAAGGNGVASAYRTERLLIVVAGCRDDLSMASLPTWPFRADLEHHDRLAPLQGATLPALGDLALDGGQVPRERKIGDVERHGARALRRARRLAERGRRRLGARGRGWAPARDVASCCVLAIGGSSFSPARGVAAARGGSARSGRLPVAASWRCGRAGSARVPAARAAARARLARVSRSGSSRAVRCDTRGAGSSGRGGSAGAGCLAACRRRRPPGPGSRRTSWAGAPTTCSPPRSRRRRRRAVRAAPTAPWR